jgi:hypothetical protein
MKSPGAGKSVGLAEPGDSKSVRRRLATRSRWKTPADKDYDWCCIDRLNRQAVSGLVRRTMKR